MSHHHRRMRAQYNTGSDTRPTGPGGVRDNDPRRPGGATAGTPAPGDHDFNPRPSKKRWPYGRS